MLKKFVIMLRIFSLSGAMFFLVMGVGMGFDGNYYGSSFFQSSSPEDVSLRVQVTEADEKEEKTQDDSKWMDLEEDIRKEENEDNNAGPLQEDLSTGADQASLEPVSLTASDAQIDKNFEEKTNPVLEQAKPTPETTASTQESTQEAVQPVEPQEEITPTETAQQSTAPVTYSFGSAHTIRFRVEVDVTNNSGEVSNNIQVDVPLPENNSPYQTTSLISTNYPIVSSAGRVSTFHIGELLPGETKTIVADYNMTLRPVSINSTNNTVETARQIYNKYAGSGNCYTLAVAFVNDCTGQGLKARVVTGFARTQRTNIAVGSLAGFRHSWAEFYVDGLGWVPVDLTFKYFGNFPHASHVVETYNDQSIRVRFQGGSLGAVWKNSII
ncbi:transglutaminase-like domain-containing protein [Candidatus Contubernalis alkaliaceticus]|uniref:transglutaminase-like domain-containing protein n=1 Tax=Candidatus Contubernalis alkaliaceticus TaxID=338645 RepID=UPI001F4C25A3|nr:transglutaminase domain-containing protein [Candidatus Contubernalis alkalaceticus]UNC90653.1 hypothetical protein HUE98_00245 [Candidatus Contubernalis alkalaceticus]